MGGDSSQIYGFLTIGLLLFIPVMMTGLEEKRRVKLELDRMERPRDVKCVKNPIWLRSANHRTVDVAVCMQLPFGDVPLNVGRHEGAPGIRLQIELSPAIVYVRAINKEVLQGALD
ncbi:hypothetical protein GOP47_0017939 [Adiantum capillus-veneris]|uniref:Uncharacterized protein n=1 Tax=Adiantum capillus-veneris TaxID=13818 RepID=A0A9D4UHH7_ADICA|nr:hypothetical protein GOP47_0017939 [Adiantum capillus-veneris]